MLYNNGSIYINVIFCIISECNTFIYSANIINIVK